MTKRSSDRKIRIPWPVIIVLARIAAIICLALASLLLYGRLPKSQSRNQSIRAVNENDAPQNAVPSTRRDIKPPIGERSRSRDGRSPKNHFKSYPGLANDTGVACGGHLATSCDQCPRGHGASWCNGDCEWRDGSCGRSSKLEHIHPDYLRIVRGRYAFQPVMNNNREYVNVILVRSPFRQADDKDLYAFYKDDILFLGISSYESFPLETPNPYSRSNAYLEQKYLNLFPGFLHMMKDPDNHFPRNVERILMSQSDFMLDEPEKFGREHADDKKVYDFVYSGGVSGIFNCTILLMPWTNKVIVTRVLFPIIYIQDQDVEADCVGWASYNKNFSFVREALEVMCSPEFNVTGVLVANKNKAGTKACTIPDICRGRILQTTFLGQDEFFGYLAKVRRACNGSSLHFAQFVTPLVYHTRSRRGGRFYRRCAMPARGSAPRPWR